MSSLPALPLPLFSTFLDHTRGIITATPGRENRIELVEELFKQIMERVGDSEKEFAMRWWADNKEHLVGGDLGEREERKERARNATESRL